MRGTLRAGMGEFLARIDSTELTHNEIPLALVDRKLRKVKR